IRIPGVGVAGADQQEYAKQYGHNTQNRHFYSPFISIFFIAQFDTVGKPSPQSVLSVHSITSWLLPALRRFGFRKMQGQQQRQTRAVLQWLDVHAAPELAYPVVHVLQT